MTGCLFTNSVKTDLAYSKQPISACEELQTILTLGSIQSSRQNLSKFSYNPLYHERLKEVSLCHFVHLLHNCKINSMHTIPDRRNSTVSEDIQQETYLIFYRRSTALLSTAISDLLYHNLNLKCCCNLCLK